MTLEECYAAMGGDYADVKNRFRTDERIVKFLSRVTTDPNFELLTVSLKSQNVEEAFRAAHTMKGLSLNLSLTALGKAVNELTEALRGKTEIGHEIEPLYLKVKDAYTCAIDAISKLDPIQQ